MAKMNCGVSDMKINIGCLVVVVASLFIGCTEDSRIGNVDNDACKTEGQGKCGDEQAPQACEIEGQVQCKNVCINPKTNNTYCGADENCQHFTTCNDLLEDCREGACVAKTQQPQACEIEGQVRCKNVCINPKTNNTYCGADENCKQFTTCDDLLEDCREGACVPKTSVQPKSCQTAGQIMCGDVCVDPLTSLAYCGADENCEHYTACDALSQNCSAGTCVNKSPEPQPCQTAGQVKCGDVCIDPLTNQTYCGADAKCEHYTTCGDKQSCEGGTCHLNVSASDPSFATDDGIPNGITLRLINKSGKDICYSGKFIMYIKENGPQNGWGNDNKPIGYGLPCHLAGPSNENGGYAHWHENKFKLKPDEYKDYDFTEFIDYSGNGSSVQKVAIPIDKYVNGKWYFYPDNNVLFESSNGAGGIPAIKMGHAAMEQDGTRGDHAFLLHVRPVNANDGKLEKGKKYNLIIYEAVTDSKYWYCD